MRNIDVIYKLLEICRRADGVNARIEAVCELDNLDVTDLSQSEYGAYIVQMRGQVLAAAALLHRLTADYRRRLDEVDFSSSEFLTAAEHVSLFPETLCEEWDHLMELFWSLDAFCEYETTSYLQMTQTCYQHDFEPINLVIGEAGTCQNGFSGTAHCAAMKH